MGVPVGDTLPQTNLVYVSDQLAGITRVRSGKDFTFRDVDGRVVRDKATLMRVKALAIPPAWTDVWISPDPNGHIQATGRDAKDRKQYIYHPDWQLMRGESKYGRLAEIARLLPGLRERIEQDLKRPAPSKPKVLATVVKLLETTLIRIGNSQYAKDNDSYGLTTLRDEHVEIDGSRMRFEFRGKSGKTWQLQVSDRRIANVVRACQELPGQHLFQYVENGERHAITSNDVNGYLRDVAGAEVSAKDLRTWAGTVLMLMALSEAEPARSPTQAKRMVSAAIKRVSQRLGNTPAVCRKSYVHPRVIDAYVEGRLIEAMSAARARSVEGLSEEERAVLALIESENDGTTNGKSAPPRSHA